MPIVKDLVQVLRVYEQGNTSQVVVFLGRRCGQLRVLAKGVRRSQRAGFAGGFDLLSSGELLAYARHNENLWIFKEWDERARRPGLGRSWEALRGASFLCELTEALTRETAGATPSSADEAGHAQLHDLLAQSAEALAREIPPGPVLLSFALRALEVQGMLPDLNRCSRCDSSLAGGGGSGATHAVYLSQAGLECEPCAKKADPNTALARVKLPLEALRALAFIKRTGRTVKLSKGAAEALARALILLVHAGLEHDLQTLRAAADEVRRLGAT